MLGSLTPEQAEAKMRIEDHFKAASALGATPLEAFIKPPETDFEEFIRAFMDVGRLVRAREIKDDELKIEKETSERIEAAVRDYHIIIDSENKAILHDCEDWRKGLANKRFCKHIGKLFMSLKREEATRLLRKIYNERTEWQFGELP
jgi:hypothetical protein